LLSVVYAQDNLTADPSSFQFSANAGSTTPQTDTSLLVNTGGAISFTINSSAPWLSANPSQGNIAANGSATITISANPTGLQAGTYNGTLTVTASGRTPVVISVQFSIQGVQISVDPSNWTLALAQKATSQKTVAFSLVGPGSSDISISSTGNWLTIDKSSGTTPTLVTATVDTTGLAAGIYNGAVTAVAVGAPSLPASMSVTLTVKPAQTDLQVTPSSLPLSVNFGPNSTSGSVTVTNVGPSVQVSASSNQSWLTAAFSNGSGTTQFAADSSQSLTVTANAASLDAGQYQGTITVSAPGRPTRTVSVTLTVNGTAISLDPSSLSFSLTQNSSSNKSVRVSAVSNGVSASASFSISTPTVNWVSIPSSGTTGQPVGVTVNSTNLAPGSYQTSVTFSAQPAGASLPKTLSISVVVTKASSLVVSPTTLDIDFQSPVGQVSIGSSGGSITFAATPNHPWISVTPGRSISPATLSIAVDTAQYDPSQSMSVAITPDDQAIAAVTIPITIAGAHRYSIPQIADGGAYQTSIILVNPGTQNTTASITLHRSDPADHSTLPWNPAMVADAATQNVIIAPKTSYTIQTAGLDPANTISGWAEVFSTGPIGGFAIFRQRIKSSDQEAAVPVNVDGATRFFLPYDNQSGFVTAMALANLSSVDTANVSVTFRSRTGGTRTANLGSIPPLGQWPFSLLTPFDFLEGDAGIAEFSTTTGLLSPLGLRFNPSQAFTSFEAQYPSGLSASRYSIPQIADGGAYQTTVTVVNDGQTPATISLRFYKSDPTTHATQPWEVPLVGNAATQNVTIDPGNSFTVQTAGSDPNNTSVGWAEVVTGSPVSGFAVFRQRIASSDQEAAVPINIGGAQDVLLPYDNQQGFVTGVAVVNLSSTDAAPVTVTLRGADGQARTENLGTIPAMGHWAFVLGDVLTSARNDQGVAEFSTNSGQLSILGLRFNPSQAFTSFRAIPLQ
jgi:hypothetical protein